MKRVVVIAAEPVDYWLHKLVKELQREPAVTPVGVVLETGRTGSRPPAPVGVHGERLGPRVARAARRMRLAIIEQGRRVAAAWHDRFVPANDGWQFQDLLEDGKIPLFRVASVNDRATGEWLAKLGPDLAVVAGAAELQEHMLGALRLGALRIQRGDAGSGAARPPRVGGGHGDRPRGLTVTVRFAGGGTGHEGTGVIVESGSVPIERYDNGQSLALKAEMLGIRHGLSALRRIGAGSSGTDALPGSGVDESAPPSEERFPAAWQKRERNARRELRKAGPRGARRLALSALRLLRAGYYFLALPALGLRRRGLEREGRAPVTILYYHAASNTIENWMTVPLEILRAHVEYAKKYFEVVSAEEAVRRLRSGENRKAAVVFTFDDGYKSCHTFVKELFEYYEIPACFFVCAHACERQEPLPHDVAAGYPDAPLMNLDELKSLVRAGFEVGSHGLMHEHMASLSPAAADRVLGESRQVLEQALGTRVRYFSFPYGDPASMSAAVLRQAQKYYDACFSAYGGYNLPDGARFQFQRIANPFDVVSFKAICNGVHRFRPFYVRRLHET